MMAEERIARLEALLHAMASALLRKDTEQDGNYGYPSFHEEMTRIFASTCPHEKIKEEQFDPDPPRAIFTRTKIAICEKCKSIVGITIIN